MDEKEWYDFLHDEYFVWKYTAKNRLATTRSHLSKRREGANLTSLHGIRSELLQIDPNDIGTCIDLACQIPGLGVAGGSGLLSLLYPEHFATVDQFVVKALLEIPDYIDDVKAMKPENLTLKEGAVLTHIMRAKAAEMNSQFRTAFWTPRTVEMTLWAYRANHALPRSRGGICQQAPDNQ